MSEFRDAESGHTFDTMRPPGILTALAIFLLQLVAYGVGASVIATEYLGLDITGTYILTMLATASLFPANLMINFGRSHGVKFIRLGALFFAFLPIPSLFLSDKYFLWGALPIVTGLLVYLISKSHSYMSFVAFYQVAWERHNKNKSP